MLDLCLPQVCTWPAGLGSRASPQVEGRESSMDPRVGQVLLLEKEIFLKNLAKEMHKSDTRPSDSGGQVGIGDSWESGAQIGVHGAAALWGILAPELSGVHVP